jgi:hypothetical protein
VRHETQLDVGSAEQRAGQQADLVLPAPPLAAGVDVEDPQDGQRGCGPSRPSTRRSSASVNGLWR